MFAFIVAASSSQRGAQVAARCGAGRHGKSKPGCTLAAPGRSLPANPRRTLRHVAARHLLPGPRRAVPAPQLRQVPARPRRRGAAGDRAALGRRAGLVRRRPAPAGQRHPQQPHPEVGGGDRRRVGVPPPLRLRQRQHPRPPGPAGDVRARQPPRDPHRARRADHGLDGPLRRQAPEQPQRRGGQPGRRSLVHRPGLRPAVRLRGRAGEAGAAAEPVSPGPGHGAGGPAGRQHRGTERPGVLPGREAAVRRRVPVEPASHPGL